MASTDIFNFETVAALIAALKHRGVAPSMADYTKMAQFDGKRTASSFEHQFRKVKARANELLAAAGEKTSDGPKKAKGGGRAKNTASPAEKKNGGKRDRKQKGKENEEDEGEEESPSKKVKSEPEEDGGDGKTGSPELSFEFEFDS